MAAAGVPTAAARVCTTAAEVAAALDEFGPPYVVKDDGLAAGKGVVVTTDRAAALDHAAQCGRVLVEEYLDGPEVSLFCLTDGTAVLPLLPAQDFKRIGDGDTGPNTGGMGAYAPLDWLPDGFTEQIVDTVARPTIDELRRRGTPFAGLLYIGLAVTGRGPRVVEFNARFGDPETQVVLALLDTPLAGVLRWAATGGRPPALQWRAGSAVTVVLAAAGYPGPPRTGEVITGAEQDGVIHAGTRRRDDGAIVVQWRTGAVGDRHRRHPVRRAGGRLRARRDRRPAARPVAHGHRPLGRRRSGQGLSRADRVPRPRPARARRAGAPGTPATAAAGARRRRRRRGRARLCADPSGR